jgi:peptide/nickel transport system permease protein
MAVKALDPKKPDGMVTLAEEALKPRSIWSIAMRRFLKHRMAVFGTILLSFVMLFVTVGAFFFAEDEGNFTNTEYIDIEPGGIVVVVPAELKEEGRELINGEFFGVPGESIGYFTQYMTSTSYGMTIGIPAMLTGSLSEDIFTEAVIERPIFGTDGVGRNVFVRTIYGGQISLAIGVTAVIISITLGTLIGLFAGFFGGIVDNILSRITEMFLSIPALILALVLSSVFAKDSGTVDIVGRELSRTVIYIVLLIGFTSWMPLSRIVRSQVLALKEQEFVMAARAIGVNDFAIILRHLLPNIIAPVVVAATLGIGTAIITEAYLSYLGFGVQPPTATWGNIINGARGDPDTVWWLWMFPGVFIVLTVLAINFIGDGLRDALDPRAIE